MTLNPPSFLPRQDRYSAKNNVKPVKFYCAAPQASRVSLVGEFNAWQPWANPLERQPDGLWTAQVNLPHGHHQYLFLVDDEPMLDPRSDGIVRNARNERVSLIAVS